MSDLVERYVAAVARELPKDKAGDIAAELRDTLLSELEARAEDLGRPLTRAEVEAQIAAFSHPLSVAARYRGLGAAIGPELYPFWLATLKVVFAVAAAAYLALLVIELASTEAPLVRAGMQAIPSVWSTAVQLFAVVTLTFVILERLRVRSFGWKPSALPPAKGKAPSRFESATELAFGVVFVLWWTGAISFRNVLPGHAVSLELGDGLRALYWPVLAYSLYDLAVHAVRMVSPGPTLVNSGLGLARALFGLVVIGLLLASGDWVEVQSLGGASRSAAEIEGVIHFALRIGFLIGALVFAVRAVTEAWRIVAVLADRRRPAAA